MKMKTLFLAVILCALCSVTSFANKKKPAISEASLVELQTVRTVFVDGNNESADKVRDKLESLTCLKLTNNKAKADAVMSVDEQARIHIWSDANSTISASVIVTMSNGDQVWDGNKLSPGGFVHSGAGSAATEVLRALAKDACPGWKLVNEGSGRFHKEYVRPEPQ